MVEKTCFVIAPIGEPKSETRKHSDQLFTHIIKPATESLGYKSVRADHIAEPGLITSQIIQYVTESPLVIADLTGHNPNVFYELAIRHALEKPIVQMITKNDRIPFDIASSRTIQFDIHDLDNVQETKNELTNQIKNIESKNFRMETPLSHSFNLKLLQQSTNPEQQSLLGVVENLADLKLAVAKLDDKISNNITPKHLDPRAERELIKFTGVVLNGLAKIKMDMEDKQHMLYSIQKIRDIIRTNKFSHL